MPDSASTTDSIPPKQRTPHRRFVTTALIVIAVLVLVLVGDRLSHVYAEDTIASKIQQRGFGVVKPDVTIDGFPFLTQVAARHFPRGHLSAHDIHEGPLTIAGISGDARDVRIGPADPQGAIGTVDGTATVGFGDLTRAAGRSRVCGSRRPTTRDDAGHGRQLSGTATAQVTQVGGGIRVHTVSVEGFSITALGDKLDFTVPIPPLPLDLTVQSLSVTSRGVELRVTGANIPFGREPRRPRVLVVEAPRGTA